MDVFNISMNLYLLTIVIRIVIGIILLSKFFDTKYKQTVIILYYSVIVGESTVFVMNNRIVGLLVGLLIGLLIGGILSILLSKYGNKKIIVEYIFIFINYYAAIETVFYLLDINFSEILKTYDDIYVDYKTIYAKIIIALVLTSISLILVKLKRKIIINDSCLVKAIGAYFIISAIFSNTMHPMDKPDTYFDFWLPLLNVNYSPYSHIIPEVLLIIVLVVAFPNAIMRKNNEDA